MEGSVPICTFIIGFSIWAPLAERGVYSRAEQQREKPMQQLQWHTNPSGLMSAEARGYTLTVRRMYPDDAATFSVQGVGDTAPPHASGDRPSVGEAIVAAEQAVAGLTVKMRPGGRV